MTLQLDEDALLEELEPLLDDAGFRTGIANLASDPFFTCFFLVSVSQGEGLGEAAVGMIGQDELAARIRALHLDRQEAEERGHKEQTLDVARALFPDEFDGGRYRFEGNLMGRPYYVTVLEANRERLKREGRYSRLNLYLTTTFGYEIMVLLLYRSVAAAIAGGTLPEAVRGRIARVLEGILAEEETHVGVVEQHQALLDAPRGELSADARAMVDALASLDFADYRFTADLAVRQVVDMMSLYADPERARAEIHAGATQ